MLLAQPGRGWEAQGAAKGELAQPQPMWVSYSSEALSVSTGLPCLENQIMDTVFRVALSSLKGQQTVFEHICSQTVLAGFIFLDLWCFDQAEGHTLVTNGFYQWKMLNMLFGT